MDDTQREGRPKPEGQGPENPLAVHTVAPDRHSASPVDARTRQSYARKPPLMRRSGRRGCISGSTRGVALIAPSGRVLAAEPEGRSPFGHWLFEGPHVFSEAVDG